MTDGWLGEMVGWLQWLVGCKISMDELVMVERRGSNDNGDNGEEE
jgi:hypothetical protein